MTTDMQALWESIANNNSFSLEPMEDPPFMKFLQETHQEPREDTYRWEHDNIVRVGGGLAEEIDGAITEEVMRVTAMDDTTITAKCEQPTTLDQALINQMVDHLLKLHPMYRPHRPRLPLNTIIKVPFYDE